MTDTQALAPIQVSAELRSRINSGAVDLDELMKLVAPPVDPDQVDLPSPPLPAKIREADQAALERLPEVFGKVVPVERRSLTPEEITAVAVERQTIDQLIKMLTERKEEIRKTVSNHLDCVVEEAAGDGPLPPRDRNGYYLSEGTVVAPDAPKPFKRIVVGGAPKISAEALEDLLDDPRVAEFYSRQDFLAMTRQIRVFDEASAMAHLRKRPDLVGVIGLATEPARRSTRIDFR